MPTSLTVDYCDVEGGEEGVGGNGNVTWGDGEEDHNINLPPLFESSNDFHIQIDSPCRETGNKELLPKDTFDLDGDGDREEPIPFDLDNRRRVIASFVDMGAYEFLCDGDADGNGRVDFDDILLVISTWGPCPEPPATCSGDLDQDGDVGFFDLLLVLSTWGCGAAGSVPSISEIIVGMGLQWPDDWDSLLGWMQNGTPAEQANAACWMDHYYWAHYLEVCLCSPSCPAADPWGGHHSF